MWYLYVLLSIAVSAYAQANYGPNGLITLLDGEMCTTDFKDAKYAMNMKYINKDEEAFNMTLDFPIDINDSLTGYLRVDKWEKSSWQIDFLKIDGPVCKRGNELIPGVLARASKQSTPTLGKCPYKKGTYKIKNFVNTIHTSEMNMPTVPYGRFRANYQIRDKKNKIYLCMNYNAIVKRL